jgi:glycosyltransferase involved in cell wall biosynthesis
MNMVRKVAAYILFVSVYSFTWLVAVVGGMIPRRRWKPTGRIMVTGTFFNPNWYLSHITPLVRSGVKEVILVVDEPQQPLERISFVCPPKWLAKLISRAGAKAIWMILAGLRYRPDLYMGYYLAPGACTALVTGRLLGRPSCYQMTGGPVEIAGGGVGAIESVSRLLGQPSATIESLAFRVARQFDLVAVRGNRAKEYLESHAVKGSVVVITGSVETRREPPQNHRERHLIFVGRLTPIKQVHQFVEIVSLLKDTTPDVKAAVVGDGPLMPDLRALTSRLGVESNVEFLGKRKDVDALLARSRVFVLTSQSEGLSIAMAEAMCAGAVPVVADIGELRDLVIDGENGYLIEPNNVGEYARKVRVLLQDSALWTQFSLKAIEAAREHCGIDIISEKWRQHLRNVVSRASGCCFQDVS